MIINVRYIYIVDSMGKIRWATSGYATPEDLKLMWKVVKGVQKRNDQVKACSSVNSWVSVGRCLLF